MSLRESLDCLRGVVKILDDATINFEMPALKKFVDGISIGKPAEPPPDVLKTLLEKFLRGEENFSPRERRALPFIIYEPAITLDGAEKILRELNFFKTSHLRGVVSVYLNHYDDSAKTELLRRKINFLPDLAGNSLRLKKIFAAREKIFGDRRFENMTKLFAHTTGVDDALGEIGLSNFYKASNFIQAALKNFFRASVAVDVQLKILAELDEDFDAYKNIFPAVADALIQTVERTGVGRKQCTEIFYRRLGDPRFGLGYHTWNAVSQPAREIFCRWLAKDDLEIFFRITRENLFGDAAGLRMWDARENFWRAYLPRIGVTWVVLGSEAQKIARRLQDNRSHGKLTGTFDKEMSGFLFQIGNKIFAEWSHNGALRIYPAHRVKDFIGNDFAKQSMMKIPVAYRKVHAGEWQRDVELWIRQNCRVTK